MVRYAEIARAREGLIVILGKAPLADALRAVGQAKGELLPILKTLRMLQDVDHRRKITGLVGVSLWTDSGGISEGKYLITPGCEIIPVQNGEWKGVGITGRLRAGSIGDSPSVMLDVPGTLGAVLFNHMTLSAVDPEEKLNALALLRR